MVEYLGISRYSKDNYLAFADLTASGEIPIWELQKLHKGGVSIPEMAEAFVETLAMVNTPLGPSRAPEECDAQYLKEVENKVFSKLFPEQRQACSVDTVIIEVNFALWKRPQIAFLSDAI